MADDTMALLDAINRLSDRVGALERTDQPLETWTAPTLTNSWVNFGGSQTPAGYWKDFRTGIVYLRGLIKSGTANTAAFTLPTGYRPPYNYLFAALLNNGGADITGHVDLATTGTVVPTSTASVWFTLDGICFRTT
jgi:hypothetical protein